MLASKLELMDDFDLEKDDILEKIEKALKKDEIKIPAMPDIALKVRNAFKDEQYDIMHIARMVQMEAGLAAYVLKVANSPLHRGPIPIKTAKHAICRLGQHSVQNIVLTYTLRSMFETENTALQSVLKTEWQQTTHIAAISAVLAMRCDDIDPDQALLAGLLQEIGTLPLVSWLSTNHNPELNIEDEFKRLCSQYSAQIGELILRTWQFDPELVEVARNREKWDRESEATIDLADIVTVARHHYYMSKRIPCPSIKDVAAFHKLPFKELTPDDSLAILEEAKEEIDELKAMLN